MLPSKSIESISEWNDEQNLNIFFVKQNILVVSFEMCEDMTEWKNYNFNMVGLALWQCANDRFMQLNHSGKVNSVPAEHTASAINIQMGFFGHCIAFHAVS